MAPTRAPPKPTRQTQPRTYSITLKSLFSLPFRLCNPPPAVGKVRSCGMTPLIKVRLEDVLNRQHLPPLGLKDFEEWLLFVEMSPENLYFILWLREYKQRYAQWLSQTTFHLRTLPPSSPQDDTPHYSTHLAMFYARAKQTFFTPGSAYELNLTTALLSPFHAKSASISSASSTFPTTDTTNIPHIPPYPPPESFHEIELETYRTLDASLSRFVQAQLNNVGNRRVLCGILAGIAFLLLFALTPLAVLFTRHSPRFFRLAAFPGMWLGLTVLIASVNGICLGVYIFGDLRQLRKFELARPEISRPKALPAFRPIAEVVRRGWEKEMEEREKEAHIGHHKEHRHHHHHHHGRSKRTQMPQPTSLTSVDTSTTNTAARKQDVEETSSTSSSSPRSSCSSSSSDDGIHISPAYYDADDVEQASGWRDELMWDTFRPESILGLAGSTRAGATATTNGSSQMTPITLPPLNMGITGIADQQQQKQHQMHSPASSMASGSTVFTGTATFIHPFDIALDGIALGGAGAGGDVNAVVNRARSGTGVSGGFGVNAEGTEEDDEEALARAMMLPARHQRIAPFDFDGLPDWEPERCRRVQAQQQQQQRGPNYPYTFPYQQNPSSSLPSTSASASPFPAAPLPLSIPRPPEPAHANKLKGIRGVLAQMQEKSCGLASWRLQVGYLEEVDTPRSLESAAANVKDGHRKVKPHWSSPYWRQRGLGKGRGRGRGGGDERQMPVLPRPVRASSDSEKTRMGDIEEGLGFGFSEKEAATKPSAKSHSHKTKTVNKPTRDYASGANADSEEGRSWQTRMRAVWSVPAFAVPLARVLSPVVVRGQWEIVVRSALVSVVLAGVGVGVMLALPVM